MSKLDEIEARHQPYGPKGKRCCRWCNDPWPCDTAIVLPIVQAAAEFVRLDRAGASYMDKLAARDEIARACDALEEDT